MAVGCPLTPRHRKQQRRTERSNRRRSCGDGARHRAGRTDDCVTRSQSAGSPPTGGRSGQTRPLTARRSCTNASCPPADQAGPASSASRPSSRLWRYVARTCDPRRAAWRSCAAQTAYDADATCISIRWGSYGRAGSSVELRLPEPGLAGGHRPVFRTRCQKQRPRRRDASSCERDVHPTHASPPRRTLGTGGAPTQLPDVGADSGPVLEPRLACITAFSLGEPGVDVSGAR